MNNAIGKADFERLSSFIYDRLGICLNASKKTMLEGRLSKRLRALGHDSVGDYCEFLFSNEGQNHELVHLFDAVTTNKTDFFREPSHFDFLTSKILPAWQQHSFNRPFYLWSAGCSSGEEPYTLAMVLDDYAKKSCGQRFDFEIIATDISTKVLDHAKKAIYHHDRVVPVPEVLRRRYLLRSKDRSNPLVRIAPEIRKKVRFGRLNFMDDQFSLPHTMDVIFCRNVIIYFDNKTQEILMNKFCRHLRPGGNLFLGHSESLQGYQVPLQQISPTVYAYRG
ncbi:MAG: protein-glutamate O-methyltransferase [Desulfuromonadaceae bacterium]|nr:protein-glutamate O-methyltransferase [Desulfuromonadaceae bacterium]